MIYEKIKIEGLARKIQCHRTSVNNFLVSYLSGMPCANSFEQFCAEQLRFGCSNIGDGALCNIDLENILPFGVIALNLAIFSGYC